ncbi:MAG TPA: thioredoxin [bacterium]|nr:thioredoxin [bacterium]
MAGNVLELNTGNFEAEALKSEIPVLVDFWAEWCGPCRTVGPTVAQLADEYQGKIKFCKLNVDQAREVASQYGIRSIPTLMLFKAGNVKDTIIGAQPKENLKAFLDKNI